MDGNRVLPASDWRAVAGGVPALLAGAARAASFAGTPRTLRIQRYVQLHSSDDPLNDVLRASRGVRREAYDGVAELWWATRRSRDGRPPRP